MSIFPELPSAPRLNCRLDRGNTLAAVFVLAMIARAPVLVDARAQPANEVRALKVAESADESQEFYDFLDRVTQNKRGPFGRPKLFTRNSKGQISELRLRGAKLQEGDLAIVGALRHLETLDLSDSNVQDMQLIHLAGLSNLRELNLFQTKIGDSALAHLSTLGRIERLNLGRTRVTDDGLSSLKELKGLRHLALSQCGITDAGAKQLAGLAPLVSLKLGETKITDAGLLELQTLDKLRSLTLDQTAVTAEALAKFAKHDPARFGWFASPQSTVEELARRMERADFDAAAEMVTIGLALPKRGAFTLLKIEPLPKNAKDEKLDRQRFRLEMHWFFLPDRIDQTFFAVTAVDRGAVGVHEMGIADKPGAPEKEKAPGK